MDKKLASSLVDKLVRDVYDKVRGIDHDDLSKAEKQIINILRDFQEEHFPDCTDPIPSCDMSIKAVKICGRCDATLDDSETVCQNCGTSFYK